MKVNLVAVWVNRHPQTVIEYLTEERQILIEQLGGKPKAYQWTAARDLLGMFNVNTPVKSELKSS
ncbi:MAG: hypothetical protein O3C43_07305 [Verrucomicrobia bacterium]|nr:hypothetical protein [Verrucomicrobiota bacterium]MDA1066293.1 hypothetical protein [Verrucomicrobiota bacterium]